MSIALTLCKSAKYDQTKNIFSYGDINLKDVEPLYVSDGTVNFVHDFDIEKAVTDGRITATINHGCIFYLIIKPMLKKSMM